MTAVEQRTPMRWSAVRDCPRKAAYAAAGAPARERTDRENRILYRGRALGRDYAIWLGYAHGSLAAASGDGYWIPPQLRKPIGEAKVLAEVPVEWPLGVGHMDGFVVDDGIAVEVLSSAHATDEMIHSKVLQLVGYIEHYEPAQGGMVVVLNPSDFSEERFPIARGTARYDELVDEVVDRIAQVLEWNATGKLPDRVCGKPADAWGHFCLHAETCFEDWQEPELEEVDIADARMAVLRLSHAKEAEKIAKAELASRELLRKEIEAKIAGMPAFAEAGSRKVGPFKLTRTDVQRKPTLDVAAAELAGLLNEMALHDYMRPGAAYTTWKVDRVDGGDALTPDDFGDVPEGFGD